MAIVATIIGEPDLIQQVSFHTCLPEIDDSKPGGWSVSLWAQIPIRLRFPQVTARVVMLCLQGSDENALLMVFYWWCR